MTTTAEPTVFVVDDDESLRSMVGRLLRSVGLHMEGYASAEEFLAAYDARQPGCLVLDVRMSGMTGLDLKEELQRRQINLPIIFLTGHGDVPMAVHCMHGGAVDFLEKPFREQILLDRIREALQRDAVRREQQARQSDIRQRMANVTERELEVLHGVTTGKSSKEIAADLGVSTKAIEAHRSRIMKKLRVSSAVDLVRMVVAMASD